jgi:hypothetical protein
MVPKVLVFGAVCAGAAKVRFEPTLPVFRSAANGRFQEQKLKTPSPLLGQGDIFPVQRQAVATWWLRQKNL